MFKSVSFTLVASFLFLTQIARAASSSCDETISGLIKNHGGCISGPCEFSLKDGKFAVSAQNTESGVKLERGENYTSIKGLAMMPSENGKSFGVNSVEVKTLQDGRLELGMATKGSDGDPLKRTFVLDTSGKGCQLQEVNRPAGPGGILGAAVDYDKEFCQTAASAFNELDGGQKTVCIDTMERLTRAFEARQTALSKNQKYFAESSKWDKVSSGARVSVGKDSTNPTFQALRQRDRCDRVLAEFELAKPRDFDDLYIKNLFRAESKFKTYRKDFDEEMRWPRKEPKSKSRQTAP